MYRNNLDELFRIIRSGHSSEPHFLKELAIECDDLFGQIKKQGLAKKFEATFLKLVSACLLPPYLEHNFILISEIWLLANIQFDDTHQILKLYERHIMSETKSNI